LLVDFLTNSEIDLDKAPFLFYIAISNKNTFSKRSGIMETIEIDFDVYKILTGRRASEDVTYNDVLRELLGLSSRKNTEASIESMHGKDEWVSKGVRFPSGTEFRASYKGQNYFGKVGSGALVVDGKRFISPSAAAVAITGNPVNGWTFWECKLPGKSSWQIIKSLRR
jgi:predicted CopG family antitoxin